MKRLVNMCAEEIRAIVKVAAVECAVSADLVLSDAIKPKEVIAARQLAMWLARRSTKSAPRIIGQAVLRTTMTVVHGVRRVEERRSCDPTFKQRTDQLLAELLADSQAPAPPEITRAIEHVRLSRQRDLCELIAARKDRDLAMLRANIAEDAATGCWLWTGRREKGGYGKLGRRLAHRVSYEIHKGIIPKGMLVCHRCDTPACTNPEHLFIGTNDDNLKDMASKGRSTRGEKSCRAKLTEAQAREIKASAEHPKVLAARHGVLVTAIHNIKSGVSWGWL